MYYLNFLGCQGAGTGLVSLVLAALLADVLQVKPEELSVRRARILATDLREYWFWLD